MNRIQVRQGDVFLERVGNVDMLPADAKPVARDKGRVVLAYGEVTGHAHAITSPNAELFRSANGERWLVIRPKTTDPEARAMDAVDDVRAAAWAEVGAILQHEEHAAIKLEPGVYRVGQQREYSPEAIRNVAD